MPVSIKNETKFGEAVGNLLTYNKCHVEFHEDKVRTGIADMSYAKDYVNGWVELKWETGHHLTPQQCNWLEHRGMAGGKVYVLWGWNNKLVLFDWVQQTSLEVMYWKDWEKWEAVESQLLAEPDAPPEGRERIAGRFTCKQLVKEFTKARLSFTPLLV